MSSAYCYMIHTCKIVCMGNTLSFYKCVLLSIHKGNAIAVLCRPIIYFKVMAHLFLDAIYTLALYSLFLSIPISLLSLYLFCYISPSDELDISLLLNIINYFIYSLVANIWRRREGSVPQDSNWWSCIPFSAFFCRHRLRRWLLSPNSTR